MGGRRTRPRKGTQRRSWFKAKALPKRGRQACGKRGYRDKVEAVTALHRAQTIHSERGEASPEKRVYRCNLCRWWHLTSMEQRSNPT
jgi:hypothetical protein